MITEQIHEVQDMLKNSGIYGCITGSSLLEANFDEWDQVPDIDVFTYTQGAFVEAITMLRWRYGFEPISKGEEWKIKRTVEHGMQKNFPLTTIKMHDPKRPDIYVNITYKKYQNTAVDVLSNFDMSIIMKGYDIHTKKDVDLRELAGSPTNVAVPNPLRKQDFDLYEVQQWVRQFDRVIKYWNRGYDTRPMARFYLEAIDSVLSTGSLFETEKAVSAYNMFADQFKEIRKKIASWLEDKEDC